jgi:hypothetical protein
VKAQGDVGEAVVEIARGATRRAPAAGGC